jgi:hypothetical protein
MTRRDLRQLKRMLERIPPCTTTPSPETEDFLGVARLVLDLGHTPWRPDYP